MKTGPKPLSAELFADRHAKRLNYTLVKVLDIRKFSVKCNACSSVRTVEHNKGHTGPKCSCTHKRKFYTIKRTPETHTQELHELGFGEYECLKVAGTKKKNTYKHSCGHEFMMSKDCFVGSSEPCSECRILGYTNEEYLQIMRRYSKILIPLQKYKQTPKGECSRILHQYVKCGHKLMLPTRQFTAGKPALRCSICYPTRVWYRFKIDGVRFKTRSKVEKAFVKFLVSKGIAAERIEYEPKGSKISYYNPVKDKQASYAPDFKVGDVHFEVKDLSSLGLRDYHWQPKEEALIENRAKCLAASKEFGDYRIYVLIKDEFYRAKKFWTPSEQNRLLNI